ncbi:MAG: hypothetical protein ABIA93_06040 [Candidatus Woesearchaeota archaeon]
MHQGIYGLVLFLNDNTTIRVNMKPVTFPEGFYIYVQGHSASHKRVAEHMQGKGEERVDLFIKKAHLVDTIISEKQYNDSKKMLSDVLSLRKKLVDKHKAQLTPIIGLLHIPGDQVLKARKQF